MRLLWTVQFSDLFDICDESLRIAESNEAQFTSLALLHDKNGHCEYCWPEITSEIIEKINLLFV